MSNKPKRMSPEMDGLEIIRPGLLTTVQDLGRYGYQQYGVPPSGAMDDYAFRLGNLLVGNDEAKAGLEITLFGLELNILSATVIAITGAHQGPRLNGEPIPLWEALAVNQGDVLSFARLKTGCRGYLAVAGGIQTPEVLGSASTFLKAQIGGLDGRALCRGDRLQIIQTHLNPAGSRIPAKYIPVYSQQLEIRVLPGPQIERFTAEGIHTFLNSEYIIAPESDRMGYRLQGPRIQHTQGAEIISDGIPPGAIQVPGNGLPIILLSDRQTTGGYTKIAVVATADIPLLAQARPGDKIRFRQVSAQQAHRALKRYNRRIVEIRQLLQNRPL